MPAGVKCRRCNRLGLSHKVTHRKKRKDAKKIGKLLGSNDLGIHTRPVRLVKPPLRFQAPVSPKDKDEEMDGDEDDDEELLPSADVDDEYLPSADFNPAMRFSAGGSFEWSRSLPIGTVTKATPWTRITAPAGRTPTNAQFGGQSASDHAKAHSVVYGGSLLLSGSAWEWCHLIADSLGGPTTAQNLCCGTYHANTAMLCIEGVLRSKTEFEIQVTVDLKAGTEVAERITYRLRRNPSSQQPSINLAVTEFVIDGQATGCTAANGTALSGKVRKLV